LLDRPRPRDLIDTLPSDLDDFDPSSSTPRLFRHSKREGWGLAIVLRMLDDRVRMQFQDGRKRTFKLGYYHLIDAVDRPLDVTLSLVDALESMCDEMREKRRGRKREKPISLAEQVTYLYDLFPDGFQDTEYAEYHRGDGRKRPLKRHRDALVDKGQTLAKRPLLAMLTAGEYSEVHAKAVKLTNVTGLVKAKERKVFAKLDEEHHQAFATSLHALLHGSSKLTVRFDAFVRTLEEAMGQTPSWALATVFLGAVHPQEHVVVREKVHAMQAAWMAPGLRLSSRPMGILYERLIDMTKATRGKLEEAGLEPRDMLDVTDFMWNTLRPKAKKRMLEMRVERGLDTPAPTMEAIAEDNEAQDSEQEAA